MSYKDFYLSRKIASSTGFGNRIWMLKLPRLADNVSSGRNLLGSLVEERDIFLGTSYPLPYPMTTPEIFLIRLNQLRNQLNFTATDEFIFKQEVSGTTISLSRNVNLNTEGSGTFPGVPFTLGLSVDLESITNVDIVLAQGAEIHFIPTEFMSRLARYFKGDDEKAFNLGVNVADQLFVDLIVLAKNYSLIYKQSKTFAPSFEAEISDANAKLGGKLNLTKKTDYSFEVKLMNDQNYLIGFKTIDWDDLDWD